MKLAVGFKAAGFTPSSNDPFSNKFNNKGNTASWQNKVQ